MLIEGCFLDYRDTYQELRPFLGTQTTISVSNENNPNERAKRFSILQMTDL